MAGWTSLYPSVISWKVPKTVEVLQWHQTNKNTAVFTGSFWETNMTMENGQCLDALCIEQRWIFMCYVRLQEGFPTASSIGYYVGEILHSMSWSSFPRLCFFPSQFPFCFLQMGSYTGYAVF